MTDITFLGMYHYFAALSAFCIIGKMDELAQHIAHGTKRFEMVCK